MGWDEGLQGGEEAGLELQEPSSQLPFPLPPLPGPADAAKDKGDGQVYLSKCWPQQ